MIFFSCRRDENIVDFGCNNSGRVFAYVWLTLHCTLENNIEAFFPNQYAWLCPIYFTKQTFPLFPIHPIYLYDNLVFIDIIIRNFSTVHN